MFKRIRLPVGSRLLCESIQVAKIMHHCGVEQPECDDCTIWPGDRYIKTVTLHWRILNTGERYSWVVVKKQHDHPRCCPHPSKFDQQEYAEYRPIAIPLAA